MANSLEIVLSDPAVKSVFVNVFGGITACDAVANGIVSAVELLEERGEAVDRPIVVRLDGNKAAEGRQILADAALPVVEQVDTMDGAAQPRRRAGRREGSMSDGDLPDGRQPDPDPGHHRLRGPQARRAHARGRRAR